MVSRASLVLPSVLCLFILCNLGCQPGQEPIERAVNTVMEKAVGPAIEKGLSQLGTTSGTISGNIYGIEPGYECTFEGKWVVGIEGKVAVRAKGLAGGVTGSIQGAESKPSE